MGFPPREAARGPPVDRPAFCRSVRVTGPGRQESRRRRDYDGSVRGLLRRGGAAVVGATGTREARVPGIGVSVSSVAVRRKQGDAMRVVLGMKLAGWLLLAGVVGNVRAAEIALVPVNADGAHAIVGNEITLDHSGQRVFLEVRISGWDPTGVRRLLAWQATINSSGYSNGTLGVLTAASVACGVAGDCTSAFGGACSVSGTACTQDADCPFPELTDRCNGAQCAFPPKVGGFCNPGFILSVREDYVFKGLPGGDISAVNLRSPDFGFLGAAFRAGDAVPDPGTDRYAATLVLDVPLNASGVYEVGFLASPELASPESVLFDDGNLRFEPLTLTPARIVVLCQSNAGCSDGNGCTDDVCQIDGTCAHARNFDDARFCCDPGSGDSCTKAPGVLGDGNLDGRVDLRDFASLQGRCFGGATIPFRCEPFDADCDCRVNVGDLPGFVAGMGGPAAP